MAARKFCRVERHRSACFVAHPAGAGLPGRRFLRVGAGSRDGGHGDDVAASTKSCTDVTIEGTVTTRNASMGAASRVSRPEAKQRHTWLTRRQEDRDQEDGRAALTDQAG
ncbi:MAG: hypothetical protein NVS3B21_22320 [Acidimicrobiales bacterium]